MKWLQILLTGGIVASAGNRALAVASMNLQQAFADTKAKLAAGQQADILFLGDSLTMRDGTYLPYLREKMQALYGDAGAGYQGFSVFTGGGLDAGWTGGQINADPAPHRALDGFWQSTTASTTGYLTAQDQHIQLQYVAQPGGGSFQPFYWLNGGTNLAPAIDTNSPVTEVRTWDFTVPATVSDNKVWYRTSGTGTVTILGQNNLTSNPGIRLHRAANGGWTTANFLQRDFTFDDQVQLIRPDLVMVFLGANDVGPFNQQQIETNMNLLIDRINADAPGAEVVLIAPHDFLAEAPADDPILHEVVASDVDIAGARGVGFINLWEVAGSDLFWRNSPYLDDQVHYSALGGQYIANLLFDAWLTDGKSPRWAGSVRDPLTPPLLPAIVPEPASLVLLCAGGLFIRRRARIHRP